MTMLLECYSCWNNKSNDFYIIMLGKITTHFGIDDGSISITSDKEIKFIASWHYFRCGKSYKIGIEEMNITQLKRL